MGACVDPVTKELNKRGYNLVKLPRVGIEPLDVLGREQDNMEKLGSITEVWTSTGPVPVPGPAAPTAGINGAKSSDLDVGVGLKMLANALAGLGAGISLPSLNVAYKRAQKVQFTFVNVESVSITPLGLGKFLASGTLDRTNPFVNKYFGGDDDTQEYIIFDVLKSDSISVTAKNDKGVNVDADVGVLSGALSANVSTKVGSSGTSEITFAGKVKATFAFKLIEVAFANGKWVPTIVGADDKLSFLTEADGDEVEHKAVPLAPGRFWKLKL
jgi:hypothetical protein